MAWESFLKETARVFDVSRGQTEVLLTRFSEENKQKSDSDVQKLFEEHYQLAPEAYKKLKTGLYKKMRRSRQKPDGCEELNNPGSHKAKHLLKWLEARYSDEAVELDNSGDSLQGKEANYLAECFNNAVRELESNNDWTLLRSIDELEQIAKDAEEKYYWRVMETLTRYVRKQSPWNKEKEAKAKTEQDTPPLPNDIQRVMTVLARRKYTYGHRLEPQRLDLQNVNLQGLKLPAKPQANMKGVDFSGANLVRADLLGANLQEAIFAEANLNDAILDEANLNGAQFKAANLNGAQFRGATLQKAIFTEAKLQSACFFGADLQQASFFRAELKVVSFAWAHLQNAEFCEANLYAASFWGANLQGTKFRLFLGGAAIGLTPAMFKSAVKYEYAVFPDNLLERIQSLQEEEAKASSQETQYFQLSKIELSSTQLEEDQVFNQGSQAEWWRLL